MSNVRQYNTTVPTGAGTTSTAILNGITVTSVHFIKTTNNGAAGDTIQLAKVSSGGVATNITNAVSLNVNDQVTVGPNAVQIDTDAYVVGATDTLRYTTVQGGANVACQGIVTGIPNIS